MPKVTKTQRKSRSSKKRKATKRSAEKQPKKRASLTTRKPKRRRVTKFAIKGMQRSRQKRLENSHWNVFTTRPMKIPPNCGPTFLVLTMTFLGFVLGTPTTMEDPPTTGFQMISTYLGARSDVGNSRRMMPGLVKRSCANGGVQCVAGKLAKSRDSMALIKPMRMKNGKVEAYEVWLELHYEISGLSGDPPQLFGVFDTLDEAKDALLEQGATG